MKAILWAMNRETRTVEILAFRLWEEAQGALRIGLQLSDGQMADGIGRSKTWKEFARRFNKTGGAALLVGGQNQITAYRQSL